LAENNNRAAMRIPFLQGRSITGLNVIFNMGLRGSTLVLRFALSFYIVKFMGLEAAGIYGLALGVVNAAPAILGWGLNYFIARDVSGKTSGVAGLYMKTRLLVTVTSLIAMTAIGLIAAYFIGHPVIPLYFLILLVVWLETISCDIHVPLIAQEMSSQANVLFFLRTSSWILPVIGLGLAFESFRNIETIMAAWSMGYILMFTGLFFFLRNWPFRRILQAPMRLRWVKKRMRKAWLIYISDMSNVGLVYADRYIVSLLLSLSLTGVYTFYWSLANALQTLISTAVLQVAIPALFKAYNTGSMKEWREVMIWQFTKTAAVAFGLGAAIFVSGNILVHLMNMPELGQHQVMFALLLLTAVVRSCTDLMGLGLNSLRKDGHYAFVNLSSVLLSIGMSFVLISTFGFIGAGLSAFFTALVTASISSTMLWRASRS
jgi:O-antigen/teichoic acid export membrane protein